MRSWLESLKTYSDRRVLSVLLLGFSSGLPLLLVYSTLSAWLKEAGVSKTAIGFASLVGSAYALKFLWSPVVDAVRLPLLTRWLGRRRGWLLLSQVALVVSILAMASTDPTSLEGLWWTILCAVAVAFASATQDIVIDAYRVEILEEHELGAGAANVVFGYRLGMLAAGAGSLILADRFGWSTAYATMAALMGVGILTTLLCREPDLPDTPAAADDDGSSDLRRALDWLSRAVVAPFLDFMRRPAWLAILLFVGLYKYGDALLGVMANPFYLELGFTKTEIGAVSKGFGLVMTLVGAFLGGVVVARLGIMRALLIGGVLQAASNLIFAWQAVVGHSVPALMLTISVENLTGGLGTAAFVAYLSSLCNIAYTATQYALLSSFMSLARTFFASGGGWLADQVSWVSFFLITTLAAIPGLLLLFYLMRVYQVEQPPGSSGEPA